MIPVTERFRGDLLNSGLVQTEGLKLEGGLPEGAGVVATQPFEKAQLLCTVPAHVMMTTATAIRSKVGRTFCFLTGFVVLNLCDDIV